MPRTRIEGRDVYHHVGKKTQTVNICTVANQQGMYEDRYSLDISVEVTLDELAARPDLAALRTWLVLQGGQPITAAGLPGSKLPPLLEAPDVQDPWVAGARVAVDRVLDAVVDTFLCTPYLHRVEHSLHAELWSLLKAQPELHDPAVLKDGTATQLVHKEWPETHPRTTPDGKVRPRGLFDMAVLTPDQVSQADVQQLAFGRIEAPIVIEVGLDYGYDHLEQDVAKLHNSKVRVPYVLHLSRVPDTKVDRTRGLLCDTSTGIRAAYAHVAAASGQHKHVGAQEVSG